MRIVIFFFLLLISSCASSSTDNKPQELFVEVDGAKLFCRTMGKGDPLIILHGGPGLTQDYLLPYLYELAKTHFIIIYDQRGCGASLGEINADTINIETYVKDLNHIREAFHFQKVSLLGHSWGSFIAMHYAISNPEHIEKLILSNGIPASSDDFALFVQEWIKRTTPHQKELDDIHNTLGFKEGNPTTMQHLHRLIFSTYCYNPKDADKLNLQMTPTAAINGAKVYELFYKNLFQKPFNLHEDLKKLPHKTLIIHGDFDPIPPITAEHIHNDILNSKLIILKNCGHFPYVEIPKEFYQVINDN